MSQSQNDFCSYVDWTRWLFYYQQIQNAMAMKPRRVLEIGPGPGVFSWALQQIGFEVVTFDNVTGVNVDIVGDIRELDHHLSPNSFDLVCCFEVLEHVPFVEVPDVLSQISSVTSANALISVPYAGYTVGAALWIARYGHRQLNVGYRIPMFWKKHEFDGEHYWELGKRGHGLSKMSNLLRREFQILKRVFPHPDLSGVLYTLAKKG